MNIARNITRRDTSIQRFYHLVNRRYWRGRLPRDVIVRWDRKLLRREHAVATLENYPAVVCIIRIARELYCCRGLVGLVILHEMAHLAIQLRLQRACAGHGWRFQQEMMRLAKLGAFRELW
jgi:hypothetical protein